MFKYSYNTLVYTGVDNKGEPIDKGIERIARFGYDGVEFVGEPDIFDLNKLKALLKKHGLEASSICSIYTKERDLVSSNEDVRKNAIKYTKDTARMASVLGSEVMVVAPSGGEKIYPDASPEQEWKWAVQNIRECAEYAEGLGVILAIEPWNRYETYFLNRGDQALKLMKDVDRKNVRVWMDTFHMNIEEESIADALKTLGSNLIHLHVADSNRAAPGRGHIDFKPVVKALKDINYNRYISFELLPAAADPFHAMKLRKCDEFFDQYTKEAIEYMKSIWEQV